MNDSLGKLGQAKRKRNRWLILPLSLAALVLLAVIVVVAMRLVEKQSDVMQQGNNAQNMNQNVGQSSNQNGKDSFFDIFKDEPEENDWVVEGNSVSKETLYGYYLPWHCSDTEIANIDVVMNRFEEKEWSTYLSKTGKRLTLSSVPLLWDGSQVSLNLISENRMDILEKNTGYLHGLSGERSYENMIRELFPEYGFTTVTYYDDRRNLYEIDCAYTVNGNDMTLLMIHYDEGKREYSLIPMEQYQVIREMNEITIYKDKNFVKYVPYNLCEHATVFQIEAFAKYQSDRYEDIVGITYYNSEFQTENGTGYGCVYFSDGCKAPNAVFDFSKKNYVTIRWENKITDYYGSVVELEGSGDVTFSYQIVQDTKLILEKDGIKYYYLQELEK